MLKAPIESPDPTDCTDLRYYKKYAHNLPPLISYQLRPADYKLVNTEKVTQRTMFYGLNNINTFEKGLISRVKA